MSEHYPVTEKSVSELQAGMASGAVSSAGLVAAYLARIEAIDRIDTDCATTTTGSLALRQRPRRSRRPRRTPDGP